MTITSQGAERVAAAIRSITPGQTVEQLLQSAFELSAASPTPDIFLYSGRLGPSTMAYQAADTIAEQLSASTLSNTEWVAFLNSREFGTAFNVALQSAVCQQLAALGQTPSRAVDMLPGSYFYDLRGSLSFRPGLTRIRCNRDWLDHTDSTTRRAAEAFLYAASAMLLLRKLAR